MTYIYNFCFPERAGAEVVECACVIELPDLKVSPPLSGDSCQLICFLSTYSINQFILLLCFPCFRYQVSSSLPLGKY